MIVQDRELTTASTISTGKSAIVMPNSTLYITGSVLAAIDALVACDSRIFAIEVCVATFTSPAVSPLSAEKLSSPLRRPFIITFFRMISVDVREVR